MRPSAAQFFFDPAQAVATAINWVGFWGQANRWGRWAAEVAEERLGRGIYIDGYM